MLAGAKPRVITFLSATAQDDKGAMLVNLGASLVRAGNDVLLVDACASGDGVAARLGVADGATLHDVAQQHCALNQVIRAVPQGFGVVPMLPPPGQRQADGQLAGRGPDGVRRLAKAFDVLVKQSGIVLVDAEFGPDGFPVPLMDSAEIVVQVSNSATSIKAAYCLIKRLNQALGRRPFGILVTGASEAEAKVVYDNMAQAASRYLALTLSSMGSVPADEYLHRAARLGRAVVDAFPLAGASVAFRQLAGRFARVAGAQPPAAPVALNTTLGSSLAASKYHTGSNHHFSV